jgi:hypothetical protein
MSDFTVRATAGSGEGRSNLGVNSSITQGIPLASAFRAKASRAAFASSVSRVALVSHSARPRKISGARR